MGPQEDYIEAVVTCEGDFHDPHLQDRLRRFQQRLESLLLQGVFIKFANVEMFLKFANVEVINSHSQGS